MEQTVIQIIENVAAEIYDKYCKYPEMYSVAASDENMERLSEERCVYCPLNRLQ